MKQKSSVKKSLSDFTERKTISMGIKMKKVLSLLLMLAMLMGMSVTSFAAETSNNVEPQSNLRLRLHQLQVLGYYQVGDTIKQTDAFILLLKKWEPDQEA